MRHVRKTVLVCAAGALVAGGVGVVAPAAAGAAGAAGASAPVVVVSGLNNPRQLSLVNGNQLLIAEAGKGGTDVISGPQGDTYVGDTGSISVVTRPQHAANTTPNRVVTGLISGAGSPDGSFAVGSDGVSARKPAGPIFVAMTWAPPDVVTAPLPGDQLGKLLAYKNGTLKQRADITGYESANDPDGHGFDSNPYAVLALPDGSELVADAAGNDVLRVSPTGAVSVFHVFANVVEGKCAKQADPDPSHPGCNYVPTSLATDSQGNVYVGGLVSEVPNLGRVTKLSPDGTQVLRTYRKFTSVTGVAVAGDGTLYVSQLEGRESAPPAPGVVGLLTRVRTDGTRTSIDVPFPAGVAAGAATGDGRNTVYVSAFSVATENGLAGPGTDGQVWRLRF